MQARPSVGYRGSRRRLRSVDTPFWSGNALDQLERFQTPHLGSDCSRVAVDHSRDFLACDRILSLSMEGGQRGEDGCLRRRQFDR